jgi:hypothetical protein
MRNWIHYAEWVYRQDYTHNYWLRELRRIRAAAIAPEAEADTAEAEAHSADDADAGAALHDM